MNSVWFVKKWNCKEVIYNIDSRIGEDLLDSELDWVCIDDDEKEFWWIMV